MSARRDRWAAAEAALRAADPVTTGGHPADGEAVERIVASPRPAAPPPPRRPTAGRVARIAVGAVATLVGVGVVAALILFVHGDGAPVAGGALPPPPRYAIFDRPQTPAEAAIPRPALRAGRWIPDSVRLVSGRGTDRLILARTPSGALCLLVELGEGGNYSGCHGPGRPSPLIGSSGGAGPQASGIVPDGIETVVVNGRVSEVVDNTFQADVPAIPARSSIDYRTAEGTVTAWHQDLRATPSPFPVDTVEAFGPRARLLQTRIPYLGVSCPNANSIACDRVGLAVWLRRPARSVVATVEGRRVRLDDRVWSGPATNGLRRRFAGFLQPAGLIDGALRVVSPGAGTRWTGVPEVTARVAIRVTFKDGTVATADMRVSLSPGWG